MILSSYWVTESSAEVSPTPLEAPQVRLNFKPAYKASQRAQATKGAAFKPLAVASADFDRDTAPDLVVGYGNSLGAGSISLQRGNVEAFAPKDDSVLQRMQQGYDPSSFVPDTKSYSLPERIDLVSTGDFNEDGYQDVLAGSTNGGLFLLTGSRTADLAAPQRVNLNGGITGLVVGEFGQADGSLDVVVGVDGSTGFQILVFKASSGGIQGNPDIYPVSAAPHSLKLARLDGDQLFDLAFVAGDSLTVVRGNAQGSGLSSPENIQLPFAVKTFAVGDFINDRDAAAEISAVSNDGSLQLLRRDDLDTRPYTAAEQAERQRNRLNVRDIDFSNASTSGPVSWLVAGQLDDGLTPAAKLSTGHVSAASTEDLFVMDAGSKSRASLLVNNHNSASQMTNGALAVSRSAVVVETTGDPIAMLPLPRKANGVRDIVVVNANQDIEILPLAPNTTVTVDRTDDTAAAGAQVCSAAANDCSLRGAVLYSNVPANPGTTIIVPAGTYQLTINGAAEAGSCNSPATGDLDLSGDGTTIIGAGATTTIIQQTQAPDRVMCADQNLVGSFDFTMSGVTIAGGRDTSGVGAGGLVSGGGALDTTTINACVFTNNRTSGAGSPVGAGIGIGRGSLTVANSVVGGTTAPGSCASQTTLDCGNQAVASGGGIYQNADNDANRTLSVSNTRFQNNLTTTGNGAGMIVTAGGAGTYSINTITNSVFTGNVGQGASVRGGGLYYESGVLTMNVAGSTFLNNSLTGAGSGGGAVASADGAGHNVTLSFARLVGNSVGAPASNGLSLRGGTGSTMTANNNWWGVNTGPPANHVNNATVANHLQLRNIASPNAILLGQSTTLTADFLVNSASGAVAASNLFALAGLPVTWNGASKGTLSNQVNAIRTVATIATATQAVNTVTITTTTNHGFSSGQTVTITGVPVPGYNGLFVIASTPTATTFTYTTTAGLAASSGGTATVPFGSATATFTAGSTSADCGLGGANATVDSQTVTGAVQVQCPDLTAVKTNNIAGNPVVGQTWTWQQAIANGGDASANFSIGEVVLTDNLPNSADISYTILTPSIVLGGVNSGTVNCAIDGSKNLSCTAGTAVVIGVGGTFNVQWSAISNVVATYVNPRGGGISQVDPNDVEVESNEGNNTSTNTVIVDKAATTTTITNAAALNTTPSVTGESVNVTWSVTVNPPGSLGAALTGNVTVQAGADNCVAPVAAGQCTIIFTTAGAKSVTAQYAGDINYLGSTSATAPHTVNPADTTTTITNAVALTGTPSVTGELVTVQWSVTVNAPGSVGAALTGNVTVSYGGTTNCSAPVAAGQCSVAFDSSGNKTVTAQYAGDANYNTSTSTGVSHTVNAADTTTTITNAVALNATPSVTGQPVAVNWNVAVNAPGSLGVALTGNVTVTDGTDTCTAPVATGTCNITFTTAGAKTITAQYLGDANYNGSLSAGAPHQVNPANTTTTITNAVALNATPSVVGEGVNVTWAVAVTAPGTLQTALTGNVTVSAGADNCVAPVAAGQCTITFTSSGAKSITAQYAGDANYNGSTSAGAPHQVNVAATTLTITSDAPDPSNAGQLVTVNWTVAVTAPGSGIPTGAVNVTVSGGAETCNGTPAGGGCSLVLNTIGAGRVITATYVGDANFSGSSDTETHDVLNPTPDVRVLDAQVAEPTSGTTNMLFTVVLSTPAGAGGVSVDYATSVGGGNPATPGSDYTAVPTTTLTFGPGQQIKTVPVQILSDADNAEANETLLLDLSNPVGTNIVDAQAVGTITVANAPGTFLISEIRTSGPGGPDDDFIELYNNTNSPLTVAASDASAGYGIYKKGADCDALPVLVGTIPNGTVIPARGHYLLVGSAYSLSDYGGIGAGAGNLTLSTNLESDANVAVFTTSDVLNISSATRLDAVGFGLNTGSVCDLLREGTNLGAMAGSSLQYSFFRDSCGKGGSVTNFGICTTSTPVDTNNNSTNFLFADTLGTLVAGVGQRLGAPGPENISSPIVRNSTIATTLVDPLAAPAVAPNRVRDLTPDPVNNSTLGTLTIRRAFTNNTGAPITRLRFRIIDMTSFPTPPGIADLRVRTSGATVVALTGGGNATVQGTTLETPPGQSAGGAVNSSLSAGTITTGTPLAPGATINLQFLLGVQTSGSFRFYINIEALP